MKPCQPGVCSCHTHLGPHLLYLLFLPLFHYYFQGSILTTRHHLSYFHHPVRHSVNDTKANMESKQELLLLLLSRFSRVRLCDPRDWSPPGSPVPRILQERTLEWVAISSSNAWKWKVKGKSLSHVWFLATPWTAAHQAPLSTGFFRQEYWSGLPLPSPSRS